MNDFLTKPVSGDELRALWRTAMDRSRTLVNGLIEYQPGAMEAVHGPEGRRYSLRWILTHMVEEYARHAGHAALPGPAILAGRQRAILTEWSAAANLPATAVAQVLARNPELAGAFLEPRAELVSAARVFEDLAGVIAAFELPEPWWESYAVPLVAHYGPNLEGFAFPWTMAVGGNSSLPRALAEEVGYLDESFVGWGLEDTDFHFRLCQAGARTRVLEGAVSYHQLHRRGPELGAEWTANARRLLAKHASVELCLYIAATRRRASIIAASAAAATIAASPKVVTDELIRAHREALGLPG